MDIGIITAIVATIGCALSIYNFAENLGRKAFERTCRVETRYLKVYLSLGRIVGIYFRFCLTNISNQTIVLRKIKFKHSEINSGKPIGIDQIGHIIFDFGDPKKGKSKETRKSCSDQKSAQILPYMLKPNSQYEGSASISVDNQVPLNRHVKKVGNCETMTVILYFNRVQRFKIPIQYIETGISKIVCSATISKDKQSLVLTEGTKFRLQKIYEQFVQNGRTSIKVNLDLSKCKDDSVKLISTNYNNGFADNVACWGGTVSAAIEFMLNDTSLDLIAERNRHEYCSVDNCDNYVAYDKSGNQYFLWTAYLWAGIVDELLNEFLYSRYDYYFNNEYYLAIDLELVLPNSKKWHFISFVEVSDKPHISALKMPGARLSIHELPISDLVHRILPDLYFNLGMLKCEKTNLKPEDINAIIENIKLNDLVVGLH